MYQWNSTLLKTLNVKKDVGVFCFMSRISFIFRKIFKEIWKYLAIAWSHLPITLG